MMAWFIDEKTATFGGCAIAIKMARAALESTNTSDWDEAQRQLREHLAARDSNSLESLRNGRRITFNEWADFFLAHHSKPPIRAPKTHEANENTLKTLRPVFGGRKLLDIDATQIESHLRNRLMQKRRVRRKTGIFELGAVKATTVHQELRVLRRILSVAVKKKLLPTNPCAGVEFPVKVKGMFRPHYMTWAGTAPHRKARSAYLRKRTAGQSSKSFDTEGDE
jgi:hypothetical protein